MEASPAHVVLCVEDEEVILRLLHSVLIVNGFEPLAAASGAEALQLAATHHLDTVILDYQLPDMPGDEVAAGLKCLQPQAIIIMFSGSICPLVNQHIDAFVAKGEGVSALLGVLNRLQAAQAGRNKVRRFPRYRVEFPVTLVVDRSGQLCALRGTSTDIAEGGMGGRFDGDLEPGELVLVELHEPSLQPPLSPRAQVCYREQDLYGFEFRDFTPLDQSYVRQYCERLGQA